MSVMDRRHLLRIAAPAVALPVAASVPVKEQRLVTQAEIKEAFRYFDMMEMRASDLNDRFNILIDMLFETNPEHLRAKLTALIEDRKTHMVLMDANTGTAAPYRPEMYDEVGNRVTDLGKRGIDDQLAPLQRQLDDATRIDTGVAEPLLPAKRRRYKLFDLPRPKLRYRLAAWLAGWRIG